MSLFYSFRTVESVDGRAVPATRPRRQAGAPAVQLGLGARLAGCSPRAISILASVPGGPLPPARALGAGTGATSSASRAGTCMDVRVARSAYSMRTRKCALQGSCAPHARTPHAARNWNDDMAARAEQTLPPHTPEMSHTRRDGRMPLHRDRWTISAGPNEEDACLPSRRVAKD